jgi:hypothetical protein
MLAPFEADATGERPRAHGSGSVGKSAARRPPAQIVEIAHASASAEEPGHPVLSTWPRDSRAAPGEPRAEQEQISFPPVPCSWQRRQARPAAGTKRGKPRRPCREAPPRPRDAPAATDRRTSARSDHTLAVHRRQPEAVPSSARAHRARSPVDRSRSRTTRRPPRNRPVKVLPVTTSGRPHHDRLSHARCELRSSEAARRRHGEQCHTGAFRTPAPGAGHHRARPGGADSTAPVALFADRWRPHELVRLDSPWSPSPDRGAVDTPHRVLRRHNRQPISEPATAAWPPTRGGRRDRGREHLLVEPASQAVNLSRAAPCSIHRETPAERRATRCQTCRCPADTKPVRPRKRSGSPGCRTVAEVEVVAQLNRS